MDPFGDHAVMCGIGGHYFTRHSAVNDVLVQAGRAAGYVALQEQVIPELMQSQVDSRGVHNFREARIDVELFGHVTAPDRLLDGTIRHPAASKVVTKAAVEPGYAADQGTKDKVKRHPPARGKSVIGCSIESWGRLGGNLDALFLDLHGLAQRRQRNRGILPAFLFFHFIILLIFIF